MNDNLKAAFLNSQVVMMQAERDTMVAENIERERKGLAPACGPKEWEKFHQKWGPVLGYNAVWSFIRE